MNKLRHVQQPSFRLFEFGERNRGRKSLLLSTCNEVNLLSKEVSERTGIQRGALGNTCSYYDDTNCYIDFEMPCPAGQPLCPFVQI